MYESPSFNFPCFADLRKADSRTIIINAERKKFTRRPISSNLMVLLGPRLTAGPPYDIRDVH
jgi:hypothetical protein